MGLGKTVMTISLVLSNPRGRSEDQDTVKESRETSVKGGTLIVCPMALLGQWKVIVYSIFCFMADVVPFTSLL